MKDKVVDAVRKAQDHAQCGTVLSKYADAGVVLRKAPEVVEMHKRGKEADKHAEPVALTQQRDDANNRNENRKDHATNPLRGPAALRWPIQTITERTLLNPTNDGKEALILDLRHVQRVRMPDAAPNEAENVEQPATIVTHRRLEVNPKAYPG